MNVKNLYRKFSIILCIIALLFVEGTSALAQNGDDIHAAVKAFRTQASQGQTAKSIDSAVKAVAFYYNANSYQEAFDLLRDADLAISAAKNLDSREASALRYKLAKERLTMYQRMHRTEKMKEHLANMERYAMASGKEEVINDLLYNKTICYYAFGWTAKADVVFKEMTEKLTSSGDYDRVDDVYQTLIANGRRSGSAGLVAKAYSGYIAWKDSMIVLKHAAEVKDLKQQISQNEAVIAEKDDTLASRKAVIGGLSVLAVILAGTLVVGALALIRFVVLTGKQRKTIRRANENIALKAKFISNISAQLSPTLKRLNGQQPEVKALQDFADHVHLLSALETSPDVELEDTPLYPFCEELTNAVKSQVKEGVVVFLDVPKLSAKVYRPYLSHVLQHLLNNAAVYTPAEGHIRLTYKKRGAYKHQFLVSNTGSVIEPERREDVFKPFLEVHDLTEGDGLGLPICRAMASKMNGELEIDPEFTKGTRFVLTLSER